MKLQSFFLAALFLLVPLTGCVGDSDVIEDASASQGDEAPSTNQNTESTIQNSPPVISASLYSAIIDVLGSDCTTTGFSVEALHGMTDWDDNITTAGWDTNLDGVIDYPVTSSIGISNLEIQLSDMAIYNETSSSYSYIYAEGFVVFGAMDESGAWSSSELLKIRKNIGYYNSNQNVGMSYIDEEPCPDFEDVMEYNFSVIDHNDNASDGSTDYLVTISRTNGQNGISWSRIRVEFDGTDNDRTCQTSGTYGCILLDGDGLEGESVGSNWDSSQSVTIKEVGTSLHRGGYPGQLMIYVDNILVFDEQIYVY